MSEAPRHRLPGDRSLDEEVARMLRVDHAGEYGATRIYQGQLDVLGRRRATAAIRQMAEAEERQLTAERRIRDVGTEIGQLVVNEMSEEQVKRLLGAA